MRSVAHTQAQAIPQSQVWLSTLSDLRTAQPQTNEVITIMGISSATDGNGGSYAWNSTSTATDDGFITVQVTGITTGRWLRVASGNTLKGTVTLSGTALQTAYPITFPATMPVVPAIVIIQAYSSNAAVPSWVSSVTASGFTANFSSVPILGTNNITINYLIIKQ